MGPQVQPKCFRHLQHMRNNWELRKRGFPIRFGHTEALLLKKKDIQRPFFPPCRNWPICLYVIWISSYETWLKKCWNAKVLVSTAFLAFFAIFPFTQHFDRLIQKCARNILNPMFWYHLKQFLFTFTCQFKVIFVWIPCCLRYRCCYIDVQKQWYSSTLTGDTLQPQPVIHIHLL